MSFNLLTASVSFAVLCLSNSVNAANFSFAGNLSTPNNIQTFNFSVTGPSNVTLRTWSYAGGTNAAGTVIARGGFDPILALFDSTGAFIGQNDDGGSNVAIDTDGNRFDTFLQPATLSAGTYTVSVMQFSNFAIGPNLSNGFQQNETSFNGRDSHWAFDVLNVDDAIVVNPNPVPEPETYAMLLAGLGLIGFSARNKKANQA